MLQRPFPSNAEAIRQFWFYLLDEELIRESPEIWYSHQSLRYRPREKVILYISVAHESKSIKL